MGPLSNFKKIWGRERQTVGQSDRHRQTGRQTDQQGERQRVSQSDRQRERKLVEQTDKQIERKIDGQTDSRRERVYRKH